MTIAVSWYNAEQTIVLMDFPQQWSWADLVDARARTDALIDTVEKPCAVVMIAPLKVLMPANVVSNATSILSQKHPRAEAFVIVVPNLFVHALLTVFVRVSKEAAQFVRLVSSIEEAHKTLIELGYLQPETIS